MGKAVYGCITAFLGAGSETWRQAAASSPGLGFVGEYIFAYIADLGRTITPWWVLGGHSGQQNPRLIWKYLFSDPSRWLMVYSTF